jgi:hypothetical protein
MCSGGACFAVTKVLLSSRGLAANIILRENDSGWWFRGKAPGWIKFEPESQASVGPEACSIFREKARPLVVESQTFARPVSR